MTSGLQIERAFLRLAMASAVIILIAGVTLAQSDANKLVLSFSNLATLDEAVDGHYEGWAIVGGSPVSTGTFNVDASGMPVALGSGMPIAEFDAGTNITSATDIKISIESVGDNDTVPAPHIILGGAVSLKRASLATGLPDFSTLESSATGAFILATPSDNAASAANDEMGIWFLTTPGPVAGLMNLPDIGPNWQYEGWVVDTSTGPTPYSTGTFGDATMMDIDAAGCNGGGPPFPGQDFVPFHCGPTLDLADGNFLAVLSVEPVPDPNPNPFHFKPMAGAIPTDGVGMMSIGMDNQVSATFPTGSAMLFAGSVATESSSLSRIKANYSN